MGGTISPPLYIYFGSIVNYQSNFFIEIKQNSGGLDLSQICHKGGHSWRPHPSSKMGVALSNPHSNSFGTHWYHHNNFPVNIDYPYNFLVYPLVAGLWRPRPRSLVGVALPNPYRASLGIQVYYQKNFPFDPATFTFCGPP